MHIHMHMHMHMRILHRATDVRSYVASYLGQRSIDGATPQSWWGTSKSNYPRRPHLTRPVRRHRKSIGKLHYVNFTKNYNYYYIYSLS